jgi:hypothetical protein
MTSDPISFIDFSKVEPAKDRTFLPTLLVDFDGVIHSYTSGWQGVGVCSDPPVPGALDFLIEAQDYFKVAIYSSRSKEKAGTDAMWTYIRDAAEAEGWSGLKVDGLMCNLLWPTEKPAAFLTLDDRCLTFTGTFPEPKTLREFQPWNKLSDADRQIERNCTIALLGDTPVGEDAMDGKALSLRTILDEGFKALGWENPGLVSNEAIARLVDELPHEMRARAAFIMGETISTIVADDKMLIAQAEALPDPARSLMSQNERITVDLAKRLARALGSRYVSNRR